MTHRWIIAVALAAQGLAAYAQTVYESQDKAGPVFSDRPSPGATAVQLPPPNLASAPAAAPAPTPPEPAKAPPPYRRLVISRPAEQDTVHSNTGAFGISASLSPPLRPADRIRVKLDGKLLPEAYRSTSVRITEQDWQAAANGYDGEHSLSMAVVDADGKPLIESAPVSFYVRHAAVGGKRR